MKKQNANSFSIGMKIIINKTPFSIVENEFIKQILIKYPNTNVRNKIKRHLMKSMESFESIAKFRIVKLNVDIDPN